MMYYIWLYTLPAQLRQNMGLAIYQELFLLKQGYRHHKTFVLKFERRYFDLMSKFNIGNKSLLPKDLSEPEFYGDLGYKMKKIVGSYNFSAQLIK